MDRADLPLPAFRARGFRTRCENLAESIRVALNRARGDPLPVDALVGHVGARLTVPAGIPGMSAASLRSLEEESADWAALTISGPGGILMVSNPWHSAARRSSALAHDCAHLLLRHAPSTLMFAPDGTWALLAYGAEQEEEARWLAACLLLPRRALARIADTGLSEQEAAARYGVSAQLLRHRMSVTEVAKQTLRR